MKTGYSGFDPNIPVSIVTKYILVPKLDLTLSHNRNVVPEVLVVDLVVAAVVI